MIAELTLEALLTLRANWLRTVLTMIGIILGVAAVVAIMSLGQSAYQTAISSLQNTGFATIRITHNYNGSSDEVLPINDSLLQLLQAAAIEGIVDYKPVAVGYGTTAYNVQDDDLYTVVTYATPVELSDLRLLAGGFFDEQEMDSLSQVAVVDEVLADKLFGSAHAALGESFRTDNGYYYKIIGVVQQEGFSFGSFESGQIYIPLSLVQYEPYFQYYGYDRIDALVELGADYDTVAAQLQDLLVESYGFVDSSEMSFAIENAQDIMAEASTFMTAFSLGLSLIAAISLLVGGVGIMNIMLVSVTERTKEIGLLKALGAQDSDIVYQFLVESVVMTLLGGLVGVAFGIGGSWLIIYLANTFGQDYLPEFTFVIDYRSIWVSLAVSLVIGLLFGAYPAKKAAGLDPVVALRRD